jgi:hypothetical protein
MNRNSAHLLAWLFLVPHATALVSSVHEEDGPVPVRRQNRRCENVSNADSTAQPSGLLPAPIARIDGFSPSNIPSGSPDTLFKITGTCLDQIAGVYALDQHDNWIKLPLSGANSTQARVLVPSTYLTTPRFVLFSPVEDFQYAQSILVYSQAVAQAVVNSNFKIDVPVVDIGGGGTIEISGNGFVPGMQAVLGRGNVAGVLLSTRVLDASYIEAELPFYAPGSDLFIAVLSADGKTLSAPVPVMSSYPYREDDVSQRSPGRFANALNGQGLQLMKQKNYAAAVPEFVEAARADPRNSSFANNAGFAFFKVQKYEESVYWLKKAIEIDPKRAVAYINLGDAYAKLNRAPEARRAYAKYLELAPNSKSVPDVKKKLDALPPSP